MLCLELEPYKYAGYPNLIATMQFEIDDEMLFARTQPLLPSATELAYHTVHCSALNAEELRREKGNKNKEIERKKLELKGWVLSVFTKQ